MHDKKHNCTKISISCTFCLTNFPEQHFYRCLIRANANFHCSIAGKYSFSLSNFQLPPVSCRQRMSSLRFYIDWIAQCALHIPWCGADSNRFICVFVDKQRTAATDNKMKMPISLRSVNEALMSANVSICTQFGQVKALITIKNNGVLLLFCFVSISLINTGEYRYLSFQFENQNAVKQPFAISVLLWRKSSAPMNFFRIKDIRRQQTTDSTNRNCHAKFKAIMGSSQCCDNLFSARMKLVLRHDFSGPGRMHTGCWRKKRRKTPKKKFCISSNSEQQFEPLFLKR